MTQRTPSSSTGLPSAEQVTELLADEFARAGYEIDDVVVDAGTRPARISVVADGDTPLTWTPSPICPGWPPSCWTPWTPARRPTCWKSAPRRGPSADRGEALPPRPRPQGRTRLADGRTVTGRLGETADGVAAGGSSGKDLTIRPIPLADIRKAVVQVEFSPPSAKELELVGGAGANRRPVHEHRHGCAARDRG